MSELYAFIAGLLTMGLIQDIRPTKPNKEK